jgi:hypothetical protein
MVETMHGAGWKKAILSMPVNLAPRVFKACKLEADLRQTYEDYLYYIADHEGKDKTLWQQTDVQRSITNETIILYPQHCP